MRMLLIEDEKKLCDLIERALKAERYALDVAADGEAGWALADVYDYDLIILDLMLPGLSGTEVLRRIRRKNQQVPILILTARDATQEKVQHFEAGADDYLTKPFAFEELVARIEAMLRRPHAMTGHVLALANLTFDTQTKQAFIDEAPQVLSARESAVLEMLLRHKDRAVAKKAVEDQLFGLGGEVSSNAVEVYVHRLRRQLGERGAKVQIHTVRGVGYMIAVLR